MPEEKHLVSTDSPVNKESVWNLYY
jgi:hypothetical protein